MNKKGITLMALVITLLVMIILTTTSVYFGLRAMDKTKNFRIYSNLTLLYVKIQEIAEEYNFDSINTKLPGNELTEDMKSTVLDLGVGEISPLWRFLTSEDLERMNLPTNIKEPGTNLFVDYNSMEIIYTNGYKKVNGDYIYKYSEMRAEESTNDNE